ncbi:MAG: hypothetical protein ACRDTU_15290 [Micromonosporaceae bacterium]
MNENDIARAAVALPDRFADRLASDDLAAVREFAEVGEWDEEIDLLVACLHQTGAAVTSAERELLATLLTEMRLPTDPLDQVASSE